MVYFRGSTSSNEHVFMNEIFRVATPQKIGTQDFEMGFSIHRVRTIVNDPSGFVFHNIDFVNDDKFHCECPSYEM